MKKQINPTIKAHLIRSAFYLLLLLGVCAIPFALAQRNAARQSMGKAAILSHSNLNASESQSALAIAAKPDFQVTEPEKDDATKKSEVPALANPDPEDIITSQAAGSSAFASAASQVQYFLQLPEVTCGAGNIRVEATNSGNNADYPTLKDAFDAINAGTHTGVINIGVCGGHHRDGIGGFERERCWECQLHFGSDHANRSENHLRRNCSRQPAD
jgi:hypothetical protein